MDNTKLSRTFNLPESMKALSELDWWRESFLMAFNKAKSLVLYLYPCCGIGNGV